MARKKAEPKKTAKPNNNAYIEGAGLVADEKITMSLEKNYMPYACLLYTSPSPRAMSRSRMPSSA